MLVKFEMNLIENYTNLVEKAKKLDRKTLEALKFFVMFLLVADLFGIYWYLHLKKLGGAILMIMIVALSIILILERRLPPLPKQKVQKEVKTPKKMENIFENAEQSEESEEESKEESEKEQSQEDPTGLKQFTEGFQDRLEKSLGTM